MRSDNKSGITGLLRVRMKYKEYTVFQWRVVWSENKKVKQRNFAYGYHQDERTAFYKALDCRHRVEERLFGSSMIDLNAREQLFQNAYKDAYKKPLDKRNKSRTPPSLIPWWYEEV